MKTLRLLLIIVSVFAAINAIGGGISLIYTNGLGMPISWLDGSLFNSYIVPGLILSFIVGGAYALSFIWQWKRYRDASIVSAIAGFGLIIWIFTELYIINQPHFLQILFLKIGIITLILSILQLKYMKIFEN